MTETAITTIVKSSFELLSSLAKDEFLLLGKSGKQLKRLENNIETILCLLYDNVKIQSEEKAVQNCLSRLRNAMYDVEGFIDALCWGILHKKTSGNSVVFPKEVRVFFSKSNQLLFTFKTAHQAKSLTKSLDSIIADMELFHFIRTNPPVNNPGYAIRYDRHRTHPFVPDNDVIGRDQDRDSIIKMLLPPPDLGETSFENGSFSLVAVIGFGGLGKTTLAQFVYNDERVRQGFDVCLWACINYFSDLEQVLVEIIASKKVGRTRDFGLETLQHELREIIGGRKFLIVLDDVWDENYTNWGSVETILGCGKFGSKVLITTRSQSVAQSLRVPMPCRVNLEVLSNESAWSLFVKKAFRKGELLNYPELEPLGREIVRTCENVPLSIVLIGALLRHMKRDKIAWLNFLENELGKTKPHIDDDYGHAKINNVLMVSYNVLHPNLKICFAFSSLFPKDHEFDMHELIRLWLSQGFIKSADKDESWEELGKKYFFHLVERCFFQEVKKIRSKPMSDIFGYGFVGNHLDGYKAKMHDLLHDLAIVVAKNEFICLGNDPVEKCQKSSPHHISVFSNANAGDFFDPHSSLGSDQKRVKTLLLHTAPKSLNLLLGRFRMLRTLFLPCLGITNISDCIGELIHLRYLDLSDNFELKHLPNSIGNLHHLMILKLEGCHLLESLPPKIEKLVSLRQLYIHGCRKLDSLPSGLATLTSLVNLDRLIVHPDSGGLGYVSGLDNLHRVLQIELPGRGWPSAIEDTKRSNMSRKHKLQGMAIHWKGNELLQKQDRDEKQAVLEALQPHKSLELLKIMGYNGWKFPSWFCMLVNLRELHLSLCDVVEYLEEEINVNVCFPSLETLELCSMRNLKGWWRQEGIEEAKRPSLPKVSHLSLKFCPQLIGPIPLFEAIEHLTLCEVDVGMVEQLLIQNPNLQELTLSCIRGLISLPEGWIRHLTALKHLHLRTDKIVRMPWEALHRLETLRLSCMARDVCQTLLTSDEEIGGQQAKWIHDIPWKSLACIQELRLEGIREMEQLPDGIQHLPSLRSLALHKCHEVRSLPNWIPQHTSLRLLSISVCSEELEKRCMPETGEDWPLIHRIPCINISARHSHPMINSGQSANEPENEELGKIGWCGLFK